MSELSGKELPKARSVIGERRDIQVQMQDGVRLMTHLWLPEGDGTWPVILVRNPYVDGDFVPDPEMVLFAEYGYAVVIQECRGRGSSEGVWEPFVNERQDGLDTLDWIIASPWCDGNIGLLGGSYLSFNQWTLADSLPSQVKTLYLSVLGTEMHRFMYMDGMFRPDILTGWAVTNSSVDLDGRNHKELEDQARKFRPPIDMDESLLGKRLDWYRSLLQNPGAADSLWQEGLWERLSSMASRISVPVCMVGGWFDIAIDSMFTAYNKLRPEVRERSRFIIGPWVHSLAPHGDRFFPNGSVQGGNGGTREILAWFDHMLKQLPYEDKLGIIKAYVIGEDSWKEWAAWPPRQLIETYYLHGANGLSTQADEQEHSASYLYDPLDPVTTVGGSGLLSEFENAPGQPRTACVLQPEPGYRHDVLTFISDETDSELRIVGAIEAVLQISSSAEDTAFTVKISEVMPGGATYNIGDGITSLAYRNGSTSALSYVPGSQAEVKLELWPTAWTIQKGSRIRLDISSSNFPAYHVHPNLPGNWAEHAEVTTASQTVYWGGAHTALIRLPLMDGTPS
ncbi:CocE/NonD family hydrolase [Paenibacillus sp. GCM10012307]|uniref:CocE/NonD family hydrolase n=1 Tax=Paenibacillus roseus TaxID=2798579 RepID=A0A934MSU4_9BACL|nr:CocE/NonD family hydrolase [Paenibacillus roseus]MBJ6364298.1 CocE/NonD family hydrolase [Paenibacillus roseus]